MISTQRVSGKYFATETKAKSSKKADAMYDFESILQKESVGNTEREQESEILNVSDDEDKNYKVEKPEDYAKENLEVKEAVTTDTNKNSDSKELSEQDLLQNQEFPDEITAEVTAAAQTLFANVVQLISEFTGKSVEDIKAMMESLGLQMQDIMDTGKLNHLIANLMGKNDVMQLLTDSELSGMMKELAVAINGEKQGFLEMFQMDQNKVNALLENLQLDSESSEITEMTESVQDMEESLVQKDVEQTESVFMDEQESNNETVIQSVKSEENAGTKNPMNEPQTFGQSAGKQEETKSDTVDTGRVNQDVTTGMAGVMEHLRNTVAEVLPEENRDVVANRIMSQITDNIRMQATPDMKSLELQLEPENLGKVTISIMAKAGHVTAEIAAQTQVAKEAIEGQLAVLKENLQQQGVKVESIEVTIASHSFEENLEKGNESKSGHQNERRQRRMISDDITDGMNPFVPETESLEETVIEDLGTNVSYLA